MSSITYIHLSDDRVEGDPYVELHFEIEYTVYKSSACGRSIDGLEVDTAASFVKAVAYVGDWGADVKFDAEFAKAAEAHFAKHANWDDVQEKCRYQVHQEELYGVA